METIENLILLAIVLLIGYNFFAGIHESYRNYNRVHFYAARDKDGELWIYLGKPYRGNTKFYSFPQNLVFALTPCDIDRFGLKYEDFDSLKWEDEPVEVFLNMED